MITKTNGNKNTPKCLLSPIQEENGTICEFQLQGQKNKLSGHFQTCSRSYLIFPNHVLVCEI